MRNTKRLAASLLTAVLALAALPAAAVDVTANHVTVSPAASRGPCPVKFTFTGKVALSKKGRFTYKWVRSDGAIDTAVHAPVVYDGVNPAIVTTTWTLGAPGAPFHPFHGWQKLHILSPEDNLSGPANFTLDCGPGTTGGGNPTGGDPTHPNNPNCDGKPDLKPFLHAPMDGWVQVRNIGTGNAGASRLILKCHKEGHTGPGGGCADLPASAITPPFFSAPDGLVVNIPPLACGAEFHVSMPWWPNLVWAKGKYDFTATADFTNLVAESNEANNQTTSTLVK